MDGDYQTLLAASRSGQKPYPTWAPLLLPMHVARAPSLKQLEPAVWFKFFGPLSSIPALPSRLSTASLNHPATLRTTATALPWLRHGPRLAPLYPWVAALAVVAASACLRARHDCMAHSRRPSSTPAPYPQPEALPCVASMHPGRVTALPGLFWKPARLFSAALPLTRPRITAWSSPHLSHLPPVCPVQDLPARSHGTAGGVISPRSPAIASNRSFRLSIFSAPLGYMLLMRCPRCAPSPGPSHAQFQLLSASAECPQSPIHAISLAACTSPCRKGPCSCPRHG